MHKHMIGTGNWYRLAKTGHSYVSDTIGHEIITGKLAVGSIMPGDTKLIERFRVSRTVLRESMKTLGAKGLVSARARIGTRVNDKTDWNMFDRDVLRWHMIGSLTPEFIAQIFEIRRAFEPVAASSAARHALPRDINALKGLADQLAQSNLSVEEFVRVKLDFHLLVLECSENPFMRSLGNIVEASLVPMLRSGSYIPDQEMVHTLALSCRSIADAIGNQSTDGAGLKMLAHIDLCQQFFLSRINSDAKRI